MSGYDSTKLTSMVEKVTAGATSALGSIEMVEYDSTYLSTSLRGIFRGDEFFGEN